MDKKILKAFVISGILFLAFIIFTLLVAFIDVKAIGPNDSTVGFAALNSAIKIEYSNEWYLISKYLGFLSLLVALCFGVLGFTQAILNRSIKKVDRELFAIAMTYLLLAIFYVLFEKLAVNFRPVLTDGVLEASYPSSHTMLGITIMGVSGLYAYRRIKNKNLRIGIMSACGFVALLSVVGRMLSGLHWFTDILGGILISAALVVLCYAVMMLLEKLFGLPKAEVKVASTKAENSDNNIQTSK